MFFFLIPPVDSFNRYFIQVSLRKSVRIRSSSDPHFRAFGLNTEIYSRSVLVLGFMPACISARLYIYTIAKPHNIQDFLETKI